MMKRILFSLALLSAALAAPASAQMGGRLSVEPYVGYGFFGELPDDGPTLEAAVAYGGRAAFQFSPQWALYGNFQQSQPEVEGFAAPDLTVRNWSAGVEFSYVPRGGAEGMLPVLLEAGLGQTRYDTDFGLFESDNSDLAVAIGVASALQLSPRFAIRYGARDFISNWQDRGVTNQIFVQVGAEVTF
jgi:hypothetical protein